MIAEIISIGSELLLGQIANTDAQFISQQLSSMGINLFYHTVVGDNKVRILEALSIASARSKLIITTGGLGPTMDDISKETISEYLGLKLIMHEQSKKSIEEYFMKRNRKLCTNNLKQAMMPEGAHILPNNVGTAPGAIVEKDDKTFIILPGPPHELHQMFKESVLPYLEKLTNKKILSRVIRIYGIGESAVEEKIKDILSTQSNPTIAPLAGNGEVSLRITAKANNEKSCYDLIKPVEEKIINRLGNFVYGFDDDNLESAVVSLLKERNLSLAVAESCTGGLISNRITNVSGSSNIFMEGFVTYSNNAKIKRLSVSENTLKKYGAVSRHTAFEMAVGVRRSSNTDFGLAVTGIAGPTGGSEEKPVGLVYIALSGSDETLVQKHLLTGNRESIKFQTSSLALNMLRLHLLNE